MILEAVAAAALGSTGIVGTAGASKEASAVALEIARDRQRLRESYTLGGGSDIAFRDLCSIVEECHMSNWDGYGALPITDRTFRYAAHFLRTLPLGTPVPSVGMETDGQITLEWHKAAYHTLSVSISPDGDLHYSALIGPNKIYGTEAFLGDIPQIILDLVRRIDA